MKTFKMTALLSCVFTVMLGGGCQVLSPSPKEHPADITLTVLQEKMKKAMDPDGLYSKSKSYVQKQMLVVKKDWEDEKGYIIEVKFKRPDKLKMTTWEDNSPTNGIIFNGKNAWIVNYKTKKRNLISGEQLKKMKILFALGRPGGSYQQIFKEVKLTETTFDEQPYYQLTCDTGFKGQPPFIIYVGKNNFLTKRIEIPPKVTSTIDKYGLYDGVITPERTTEVTDGSTKQYQLILYKLNVDIDDNEFFPPLFDENQ